jgi:hypothetical protein
MGFLVTGGSVLQCSFGMTPSTFNALPVNRVLVNMPAANIMDQKPLLNVLPFGTCCSLANPVVVAATAAALGVLTPMPCIPATVAPWIVGVPKVLIGNMPVVNNTTKLMCMWGGVISVTYAGQVKVMV